MMSLKFPLVRSVSINGSRVSQNDRAVIITDQLENVFILAGPGQGIDYEQDNVHPE